MTDQVNPEPASASRTTVVTALLAEEGRAGYSNQAALTTKSQLEEVNDTSVKAIKRRRLD
jgi:hypothetical protein